MGCAEYSAVIWHFQGQRVLWVEATSPGGRVEGEKVRAYGNSGLKVTFYCDLDEGETGVFVGREEKACSLLTKAAKTVESCSKPSKS